MNRRSFLESMIKAGVAAAFLPGAGRVWKKSGHLYSIAGTQTFRMSCDLGFQSRSWFIVMAKQNGVWNVVTSEPL